MGTVILSTLTLGLIFFYADFLCLSNFINGILMSSGEVSNFFYCGATEKMSSFGIKPGYFESCDLSTGKYILDNFFCTLES